METDEHVSRRRAMGQSLIAAQTAFRTAVFAAENIVTSRANFISLLLPCFLLMYLVAADCRGRGKFRGSHESSSKGRSFITVRGEMNVAPSRGKLFA